MRYGSRALVAIVVGSLAIALWPAATEASTHARIGGYKFHDCNGDGRQSRYGCAGGAPEPRIQGWNVYLFTGSCASQTDDAYPLQATETLANGTYTFQGLSPGTYCVVEEIVSGWFATRPQEGTVTISAYASYVRGPTFGNGKYGPSGGQTPGFWGNQNGEAAFNSIGGLAVVNALNLANATGTQADFGSYSEFASWLQAGNAVNMAYMLSIHEAAMALNIAAGFVSASTQLFAGQPPAGCPPVSGLSTRGTIEADDLTAAANASVGSDAYTPAGDPLRPCQEFIKDALDNANNNSGAIVTTPISSVTVGDLPALTDITYGDLT